MSDSAFFLRALVSEDSSYVLLNPRIGASELLLDAQLKHWREDFDKYFARTTLRDVIPTAGPFHHAAPSWMLSSTPEPSFKATVVASISITAK